jgi:hypothetical protein
MERPHSAEPLFRWQREDGQYDRVSFRGIFGIFIHHNVHAFAGAAAHYGAPQHFHFRMHDKSPSR